MLERTATHHVTDRIDLGIEVFEQLGERIEGRGGEPVTRARVFRGSSRNIVGNATMGEYLFSPTLTTELWRLSMGMGYRFNKNLVVKLEYSLERGQELGGADRDHEDLIAGMAAFAF